MAQYLVGASCLVCEHVEMSDDVSMGRNEETARSRTSERTETNNKHVSAHVEPAQRAVSCINGPLRVPANFVVPKLHIVAVRGNFQSSPLTLTFSAGFSRNEILCLVLSGNTRVTLSLEQQLDALALGRVSQQLLGRVVDAVVSHTA